MNSLNGVRKGNNFVVQIMVQKEGEKKDGGYIVPKKVATRRWSANRNMDVDGGKLQRKNTYGALTVEEEEAYDEYMECQPCGMNISVSSDRRWGT